VRVVLDTNIWVSAGIDWEGLPARIVWAFREGRFTLVTSEPLLEELVDVLTRPRILERIGLTSAEIVALVAFIRERAVIVPVLGEVRLCRDPDDDAVIETALLGHADVVVSRDEDLTRDWEVVEPLAQAGVRVLTVSEFLRVLEGETVDEEGSSE
jgi:putative PIN family toxin of toxin-antitoxin system